LGKAAVQNLDGIAKKVSDQAIARSAAALCTPRSRVVDIKRVGEVDKVDEQYGESCKMKPGKFEDPAMAPISCPRSLAYPCLAARPRSERLKLRGPRKWADAPIYWPRRPSCSVLMIPWLLGTNNGSTVPASSFHLHKGLAKSFIDWKYVLAG
jgi:hypothetical protein